MHLNKVYWNFKLMKVLSTNKEVSNDLSIYLHLVRLIQDR